MTQQIHEIPYRKLQVSELAETDRKLADLARRACATSYSPYSGFRVGAAGILDDGTVLTASNQESEVFPSGLCAERILLYKFQSDFPDRRLEALAVVSEKANAWAVQEVYPCGGCAQIFVDTERRQNSPIRVIMCGADTCTVIETARHLLPFAFQL